MALEVGRADIHMEVGSAGTAPEGPGGVRREGGFHLSARDGQELRELLRPLVLDILSEELERLLRQHG